MTYPPVIERRLVRRERWPGGYRMRGIPLVALGQEVRPDQPVLRLEYTEETFPAGLMGKVVELTSRGGVTIETLATVMRGRMGAGKQVAGVLTLWEPVGSGYIGPSIPAGAILAVTGSLDLTLLHQAVRSGVVGVIGGCIALRDLEGFLQTDLIQLLNSVDPEYALLHLPPLTLYLTEGLGNIPMPGRTKELLASHQGEIVLLSGITSLHQGIYPELVVSSSLKDISSHRGRASEFDPTLTIGALVRICSGAYEGMIGVIDYYFVQEQCFSSGIRARAVRLQCADGSHVIVPQLLLERIA